MSKPVKEMIRRELARRFDGLTSLAIVGFTGLDAIRTNQIRGRLREKQIRLTVVKNSLARRALRELGMDSTAELIEGPCAVACGGDSVVGLVRELIEIGRDAPHLTVKAALLEGEVFKGEEQVKALSMYPTREEAVAQVIGCAVSAARSLAACLIGPGAQVAALVKAVEEKGQKAA